MSRKPRNQSVTVGGAYDSLPAVAGRGIDLQAFVDAYVEIGNATEAFLAAGGGVGMNDSSRKSTASQLMKIPEVQQAVVERSAQKFFDLAPVAVGVLKKVLELQSDDPRMVKTQVQVAGMVMEKVQVEKHHNDKTAIQQKAIDATKDINKLMAEYNEFVRKNPEFASISRGSPVVIEHDEGLPAVEEHEPS